VFIGWALGASQKYQGIQMIDGIWIFIGASMPVWLVLIICTDRWAYYRGYRDAANYAISQALKLFDQKSLGEHDEGI